MAFLGGTRETRGLPAFLLGTAAFQKAPGQARGARSSGLALREGMVAGATAAGPSPEAGQAGMTTSSRLIALPTSEVRNINSVHIIPCNV